MPLFRFHRGQLSDSVKTTVVVKTEEELIDVIIKHLHSWLPNIIKEDISILTSPYPSEDNFDKRIGWYTHIVEIKIYNQDRYPVGFLSEDL